MRDAERPKRWGFNFVLVQLALDNALEAAKADDYHAADDAIGRAVNCLREMQSALRNEANE
jgi:hypothetical protein